MPPSRHTCHRQPPSYSRGGRIQSSQRASLRLFKDLVIYHTPDTSVNVLCFAQVADSHHIAWDQQRMAFIVYVSAREIVFARRDNIFVADFRLLPEFEHAMRNHHLTAIPSECSSPPLITAGDITHKESLLCRSTSLAIPALDCIVYPSSCSDDIVEESPSHRSTTLAIPTCDSCTVFAATTLCTDDNLETSYSFRSHLPLDFPHCTVSPTTDCFDDNPDEEPPPLNKAPQVIPEVAPTSCLRWVTMNLSANSRDDLTNASDP